MHKDGDEIRFGSFNSKALSVDLNLSIDQTSKKRFIVYKCRLCPSLLSLAEMFINKLKTS